MVEENCDIVWGDDWSINISGFNNCIQRCSSNCVVGPIVCIFIIPVLKHYHIWIKTSCDYTHLWFFFFACWTATLWWNLKLRFISRMLPFILLILCSIPLLKYIGGKLNWLCLMWHYKYCFTQGCSGNIKKSHDYDMLLSLLGSPIIILCFSLWICFILFFIFWILF